MNSGRQLEFDLTPEQWCKVGEKMQSIRCTVKERIDESATKFRLSYRQYSELELGKFYGDRVIDGKTVYQIIEENQQIYKLLGIIIKAMA